METPRFVLEHHENQSIICDACIECMNITNRGLSAQKLRFVVVYTVGVEARLTPTSRTVDGIFSKKTFKSQ